MTTQATRIESANTTCTTDRQQSSMYGPNLTIDDYWAEEFARMNKTRQSALHMAAKTASALLGKQHSGWEPTWQG